MANYPSDLCLLKKKVFSSWDKFQIPFPGGKGMFVWGQPIWVERDLPNRKLSWPGLELERSLNRLTAQAELAVQASDPLQYFLRSMSSHDMIDKDPPFEV